MDKSYKKPLLLITFGGDLICGIQQSKLCCQLSKIVYWLARSDFIRPFSWPLNFWSVPVLSVLQSISRQRPEHSDFLSCPVLLRLYGICDC